MPQFIIAYHGGRKPKSAEEGANHMAKWKAWVEALGDAVVNPGTPLGKSKFISSAGVSDDGGANAMTGFSVISADNIDAAVDMARQCPVLEIDGTLEVAEMMKM